MLERASVIGLEFEWEALGELAPDRQRPAGRAARGARPQGADPPARGDRGHLPLPAHADPRRRLRAHLQRSSAPSCTSALPTGSTAEARSSTRSSATTSSRRFRISSSSGRPAKRARALADAGRGAARGVRTAGVRPRRYAGGGRTCSSERPVCFRSTTARRLSLLPSLGRALREAGSDWSGRTRCSRRQSSVGRRRASARWRRTQASRSQICGSIRTAADRLGREDVLREVDAAIQVFEEVGDEAGLARALTLGGKLRFWGGEAAAALPDLERAAQSRTRAGDRAAGGGEHAVRAVRRCVCGPTPVEEALRRLEEFALTRQRSNREARDGVPRDARAPRGHAGALRRRARLRFSSTSVGGGAWP